MRPWPAAACAAALVALASPASAEPRALTLSSALVEARAHAPAARAARARAAAEAAAAEVPGAQWLPTFGVTAQIFAGTFNNTTGTYVSPGGYMDIPRIGATRATATGPLRPYPATFVAAGATQEVWDFGRVRAQTDAAQARAEVERRQARAAELDVDLAVEDAYFGVLAGKAIVRASDDARERARANRDLARAGVESGMRPPIEGTRAEADLARADLARTRARGALEQARIALAVVVGGDDASLDAEGAPRPATDVPIVDASIARALAHDPTVLAAEARVRAQEERTRAIAAEARPDLSATATVSGRAGGAPPSGNGSEPTGGGLVPYVPNWDLGLVLSFPIYDGVERARERASRAVEVAAREEAALVRAARVASVRRATVGVEVAAGALPGLRRALDATVANYAQAEARFRAGLGTSVEIADAAAVRTDAEIQLAIGELELARARAALARATGEAR